jgi:phospholipid/cholesterol/gamma-HCH transport system permease protein
MPSMVSISIIIEIGPIITGLICAGKIGSGIGAEIGSMRVTEQIDAMEVSGTNPFKYLVVTRILATTASRYRFWFFTVILFAIFGSYLVENLKGDVSFLQYFNQVFDNIEFSDLLPATIKTFFLWFCIGMVGCFKDTNVNQEHEV